MHGQSPYLAGAATPLPPKIVTGDFRCVTCSYALRGLSITGLCPECGTPVAHALRNTLLESASPEYRRRLVRGLTLVTGGILVLIGCGFVAAGISSTLAASASRPAIETLIALVLLGPQAMIMAGYWIYSTPDPGYNGSDEPVRARKIIRFTTFFLAAVIGLDLIAGAASLSAPSIARTLSTVSAIATGLSVLMWMIHFLATMRYSRWVAQRIPSPRLISRTRTYAWLIPLLALGPLVLLAIVGLIAGVSAMRAAPGGPAPPGLPAMGIAAGVVGCGWFITLIAASIMYWALFNRLRLDIRALDRVRSSPPTVAASPG